MTDMTAIETMITEAVYRVTATRLFEVKDIKEGFSVMINPKNIALIVEPEEGVAVIHMTNGVSVATSRDAMMGMMAYAGMEYHKMNRPEVEDLGVVPDASSDDVVEAEIIEA